MTISGQRHRKAFEFKTKPTDTDNVVREPENEHISVNVKGVVHLYWDRYTVSGFGHEHFWISGTDQGEEGRFFWLSNGRPITFTNWNAGEPNNFEYENGELEHCMELWDRDGKGMKWNDSPCSFETYFVCQVNPWPGQGDSDSARSMPDLDSLIRDSNRWTDKVMTSGLARAEVSRVS